MRFFVRMTERSTVDPQERAAMLRHRLAALEYEQTLLDAGILAYAFRAHDGRVAIEMFEADTLEALDAHVKRDPQFAYCACEVIPVVSTEAMVKEAEGYLGESILTDEDLAQLTYTKQRIVPARRYWLAYKEVKPFSPLLSEEEQHDIHRRTIESQRLHETPLEWADDNPVGRSVGILIAEGGELGDVMVHCQACEVFPDTEATFTELLPLPRAWDAAVAQLRALGREAPAERPPSLDEAAREGIVAAPRAH